MAPLTSEAESLKVWPASGRGVMTFSVVSTAVSTFLSVISFSAWAVVTVV